MATGRQLEAVAVPAIVEARSTVINLINPWRVTLLGHLLYWYQIYHFERAPSSRSSTAENLRLPLAGCFMRKVAHWTVLTHRGFLIVVIQKIPQAKPDLRAPSIPNMWDRRVESNEHTTTQSVRPSEQSIEHTKRLTRHGIGSDRVPAFPAKQAAVRGHFP